MEPTFGPNHRPNVSLYDVFLKFFVENLRFTMLPDTFGSQARFRMPLGNAKKSYSVVSGINFLHFLLFLQIWFSCRREAHFGGLLALMVASKDFVGAPVFFCIGIYDGL